MKQRLGMKAFVHTASIVFVILMMIPFYLMVVSSFRGGKDIFRFTLLPSPATLTLEGYRTIAQDRLFLTAFGNTLFTSSTITVFALLFASMAGFALAKLSFPGRRMLLLLIISTMMVPFALLMLPLFLVVKQMGMMDTLWALILPGLPRAYGVFLMRQFMRGIPGDLLESAKIDGCGYLRAYAQIILPLSKPVLFTLATTIFLTSWNNYTWPVIAVQSKELRVLQMHVASYFEEYTSNWALIFASLCASTIPTLILFCVCQRFLVEGIKLSGIKE